METSRESYSLDVGSGGLCPGNQDMLECEKTRIVIDETVEFAANKLSGVPHSVDDGWVTPEYMNAHCAKCQHTPTSKIKLREDGEVGELIRITYLRG